MHSIEINGSWNSDSIELEAEKSWRKNSEFYLESSPFCKLRELEHLKCSNNGLRF